MVYIGVRDSGKSKAMRTGIIWGLIGIIMSQHYGPRLLETGVGYLRMKLIVMEARAVGIGMHKGCKI